MKNLVNKKNALANKLAQQLDFVRGSITSVCSTCNRANCKCAKKSSRRAYRLTYKDGQQKTKTVYIPQGQLPKIRKMVAKYTKVRKIIDQLIEVNIEVFKEEARK